MGGSGALWGKMGPLWGKFLVEPDLGRAVAAAAVWLGGKPGDVRAAAECLADRLANRAGAFAMHDARLGQSGERGILEVLLEPLEGFIAAHAAQVELEWHFATRRGERDCRQPLGLRGASFGSSGARSAFELLERHPYSAAEDLNFNGAVTNGQHPARQSQAGHNNFGTQLDCGRLRRFGFGLRYYWRRRRPKCGQSQSGLDSLARRLD